MREQLSILSSDMLLDEEFDAISDEELCCQLPLSDESEDITIH